MATRAERAEDRRLRLGRVLEALTSLHDERGLEKAGPTEVSRHLAEKYGLEWQPSLVLDLLRDLVREGRVERIPQGERRALYRLKETFTRR